MQSTQRQDQTPLTCHNIQAMYASSQHDQFDSSTRTQPPPVKKLFISRSLGKKKKKIATLNITNSDESLTQFNEALGDAPPSRLQHIIRDVCRLLPAALPIVADFLLVSEEQVPGPDDPVSDSEVIANANATANVDTATDESRAAAPQPKKRARARARIRARYAVCVNCEVEYDVTENSRGSCCFHPGMCAILDWDAMLMDYRGGCI